MEPLKIWEAGELTVTREKTIRRFASKNLFKGLLVAFELDEGILYTIAGLFKHPGKIIPCYLHLNRLIITSPIRYFLFVEGIIAFMTIRFNFWLSKVKAFIILRNPTRVRIIISLARLSLLIASRLLWQYCRQNQN